jgi:osmotically-inducible protein OsmY
MPLIRGSFTPQTYAGQSCPVKLRDEVPRSSNASLAALIQNKMHDDVNYVVNSGVVTLTGKLNSEHQRRGAEKVASWVPNVQ